VVRVVAIAWGLLAAANFAELSYGEVRRILLPRT
jgi:hypothetical protein